MAGEDRASARDLGPSGPASVSASAAAPIAGAAAGGLLADGASPGGAASAPAPGGASTASPSIPSGRASMPRERYQAMEAIFDQVARAPEAFDFYQVLRRLEALYCDRPERPRFGAASRPADEPIRLGQEASLQFAPRPLSGLFPGKNGAPPRLVVNFFGLLGPNGPLPLHITEYTRERQRHAEDPTMGRFFDLFHHRMMLLFYRAWSTAQPTVGQDHPATNRFVTYVGALAGLGLPALRGRDALPDSAKYFYAGRLGGQTRNADGLQAVVGDFFQMPARVEPFVGSWLAIPTPHQWRLGNGGAQGGALGVSTTAGQSIWSRQQKFRVVLGPLNRGQFQRMLPGGASLKRLTALVRNYAGDEHLWDVRLILDEQTEEPCRLGRSQLGWTSWLGRPKRGRREDLILDPQAENVQTAA
jgi:type VI secretion system protein ImpH